MLITPKGRIIARSGQVLIKKFSNVNSISSVQLNLESMLLSCGWTKTLTRMISANQDDEFNDTVTVSGNQLPFENRVYLTMVLNDNPIQLEFYADSIYDLIYQDRNKPITFSVNNSTFWIVACPYQFCIIPDNPLNAGVFVSTLKLPPFARNNPWLQTLVCCQASRLFNSYLSQDFNQRVAVGVLASDGSAYYWADSPGVGQVLFYRLTNDSQISTRMISSLKHPVFCGWGTYSKDTPPSPKGFPWDMVFFLDYQSLTMKTELRIDRSKFWPFNRYVDNVLAIETQYGLPANAS